MHRPLTEPITWTAGAKSENCVMGHLDHAKVPKPNGILITDGKVSNFISKVIDELKLEKIPSLASGMSTLILFKQ